MAETADSRRESDPKAGWTNDDTNYCGVFAGSRKWVCRHTVSAVSPMNIMKKML